MLTSRPWRDDRDLERMLDLVSRAIVRDGIAAGHHHPGDVVWGLFMNDTIDPSATVHIVEEIEGVPVGYIWLYGDGVFAIETDPDDPDRDAIAREAIRLAERHLSTSADPPAAFTIELIPGDERMARIVAGAGYARTTDATLQLNRQRVDGPIASPPLAPGAVVRPVNAANPAEVAARVALHREVWESSKFSEVGYARLRERPVYRPDLDLVAVTPEGELAAYAIVWWDPESRVGEFEPVGAAVRHRQRGYASAVMIEGVRRLRDLGATDAVVISATRAESEPSRRLYASTGFTLVGPYAAWRKPFASDSGSAAH